MARGFDHLFKLLIIGDSETDSPSTLTAPSSPSSFNAASTSSNASETSVKESSATASNKTATFKKITANSTNAPSSNQTTFSKPISSSSSASVTTAGSSASASSFVNTASEKSISETASSSSASTTNVVHTKKSQTNMCKFISCHKNVSKQKCVHRALLNMITNDLQPFSIVEDAGFKEYSSALDPFYEIPSRRFFTNNLLPQVYEECATNVKKNLQSAHYVCLTTDGWTSIANEGYISLTAHFITPAWEQKSFLLNCMRVTEQHTAVNLRNIILDLLRKWEVNDNISAIVSDNAANIIAAIKLLGWPSSPCLAHTLHLIVTESLKNCDIQTLINKCKSIVEHFHRSVNASDKLKELQRTMNMPQLKLIMDTPTRWNSTLQMMIRLLEIQEPLEAAIGVLHNPVTMLRSDEWDILHEVCECLKPFNEITSEMSGEKYVTISKVIILVRGLQAFLKKKQSSLLNIESRGLIEKLIFNLGRRFHRLEENFLLSISTLLDPRYKSKAFNDEAALRSCKEKVICLMKESSVEIDVVDTEVNEVNAIKTEADSIWADFDAKTKNLRNRSASAITQLNQYLHEEHLIRSMDPLDWWKKREAVYPQLANIAKRFLGIVATSVPSERVFSKAGQVLSARRNRLKAENAEKVLFLNFNKM